MYHQPIQRPVSALKTPELPEFEAAKSGARPSPLIWSVVILCTLPLVALYLLFRFAWRDLLAVGRGLRLFQAGVAEELSRKR